MLTFIKISLKFKIEYPSSSFKRTRRTVLSHATDHYGCKNCRKKFAGLWMMRIKTLKYHREFYNHFSYMGIYNTIKCVGMCSCILLRSWLWSIRAHNHTKCQAFRGCVFLIGAFHTCIGALSFPLSSVLCLTSLFMCAW